MPALSQCHLGIVYNTKLVKEQELPETWKTSPTPSGRAALSCGTTAILDFIAQKYGKERALELARKLKANKPILSRSAAILTLTQRGEAPGTTAITATLGRSAKALHRCQAL